MHNYTVNRYILWINEGNNDENILKTIGNLEDKSGLVELNRMYQDSALVRVNKMDQEVRLGECENVYESGKKYPLTRRIAEQQQTSPIEPTRHAKSIFLSGN